MCRLPREAGPNVRLRKKFHIIMTMNDEGEMSSSPTDKPSFAGPHEGRELELMLRGVKPLSMFVEPVPPEFEYFPEQEFDSLVSHGRLVKRIQVETKRDPSGKDVTIR